MANGVSVKKYFVAQRISPYDTLNWSINIRRYGRWDKLRKAWIPCRSFGVPIALTWTRAEARRLCNLLNREEADDV